jgi:serine/threonine protein kinase
LNGIHNLIGELSTYEAISGKSIDYICSIYGAFKNSTKEKIYVLMARYDFSLTDLIYYLNPQSESTEENGEVLLHSGFNELFCRYLLRQLLQGLQRLHSEFKIVHNDIKEQNIMFSNHSLKIIDFGVAQVKLKNSFLIIICLSVIYRTSPIFSEGRLL